MSKARVLVLATLSTKAEETDYLLRQLSQHDVTCVQIDTSLNITDKAGDGTEKLAAINDAVLRAGEAISRELEAGEVNDGVQAVIGLGGGTGSEIALRLMRELPMSVPKILITTLPFDPRTILADSSIILVPTLVDICGLNATLREVLENAAYMTAGLCSKPPQTRPCMAQISVGISALGATEEAVIPLVKKLKSQGVESTVFHANGYGGAAFTRFVDNGAFHAMIDLTPHEMTRIHLAGAHAPMDNRFTCGGDLPRVVLPGALNFIGLGEKKTLSHKYLNRDHYEHSNYFTHAKLDSGEMQTVATLLADSLNQHKGNVTLIVPMGGFSHQDRPGGAIEDANLRRVFLDTINEKINSKIHLRVLSQHISEPEITDAILDALPFSRKDFNVGVK